ncbi:MAG: hypothetical protein ABL920_00025 [Methylotenera sp.]|nr:hypothetical protein [Methylotenera sp.]
MNTNSAVKSRRHLISDVDFSTAQQALELAGLTMNPERSQRCAFKELMPDIYFMRHQGYSFQKITALLNQIGFKLQASTSRIYFHNFLDERQDECIKHLNRKIQLLDEITKKFNEPGLSSVAEKIEAIIGSNQKILD